MSEQIPTPGRIVRYRVSEQEAEAIMRRRTSSQSIAARITNRVTAEIGGPVPEWPLGAQAHIGNAVEAGDEFPMLIVRAWGDQPTSVVNGQVFLDGNDVLWALSVGVGEGPHTWSWPTR